MKRGTRIRLLSTGATGTVHLVFPNGWLVIQWDLGTESGCWAHEVERTNMKRFDFRGN